MSDKKKIEQLFDKLLFDEYEKKIMEKIINERDSDKIIESLLIEED